MSEGGGAAPQPEVVVTEGAPLTQEQALESARINLANEERDLDSELEHLAHAKAHAKLLTENAQLAVAEKKERVKQAKAALRDLEGAE